MTNGKGSADASAGVHTVADQSEAIDFLSDPASYEGAVSGADEVERIDTHGAHVFLVGDRAYKMKRAVRFPYMDFSTLERRRRVCEREIELNRRTAPDLYLRTEALVRRPAGGLAFGGADGGDGASGEVVEWLVVMVRFDQDRLASRMAASGTLTPAHMERLAAAIADLHEGAERIGAGAASGGGAATTRAVALETLEELKERPDLFAPRQLADLEAATGSALDRHAALLDARLADGFVRRCHGDLHLRNVCVIDDRPTLFDAIEFNDEISCIDILYDLSFLLMDLAHNDLGAHANLVFNRWHWRHDDIACLALLPLYLSMRAGVRAKVAVSMAEGRPDDEARRLHEGARGFFGDAAAYLDPPPPRLVAVGGLSGSGKSTVARALAPDIGAPPGALHLQSDVLRKQMFGAAETDRLPPEAYTKEASADVYATMMSRAAAALAAGRAVVVDAVFAAPAERDAAEAAARDAGVPFTGLWLDCPASVLLDRVGARRGDVSDADRAVVQRQLDYELGRIDWHSVDAAGDDAASRARRHL